MRPYLLIAFFSASMAANAQYYYKDILGTKESSELVKTYLKNKVNKVVISSFNAKNEKDENFYVEQRFSPVTRSLTTITRASSSNPSFLVSYFDEKSNVIKTVDSSEVLVSSTTYQYNPEGQLLLVVSTSSDSAKSATMNEHHIWQWNGNVPIQMLRIKNHTDTIFVSFKTDEQGNVIEEQETHKKKKAFPNFYYYNSNRQLTDIAQHNARVDKLLPIYMFEYSAGGQVIQKITVPSNHSDYLIWRYQYNENGLKTKEAVYNKQKKLTGRIEYQYSFDS